MCAKCGIQYRSKELSGIVPPPCNFGYDILVYVGKAVFIRHLANQTIVEQLAVRNVDISPSEIAYLEKKFIAYLTVARRKSAQQIKGQMALKGGYILLLDATYEDNSPLPITGLDSIMKIIVLNCKLLSKKSDDIVPFFEFNRSIFMKQIPVFHIDVVKASHYSFYSHFGDY